MLTDGVFEVNIVSVSLQYLNVVVFFLLLTFWRDSLEFLAQLFVVHTAALIYSKMTEKLFDHFT